MRAIVTGALQATAEDLAALEALGLTVTVHPDERAAVENPEQYEIALCNNLFGFHDLDAFPNLKYIQLTAAGMDRVPLERIRQRGALWGVLELYKQGRFFAENQRLHRWEKHRSLRELSGKTVLIVGCGSVGSECARRFAAFGCKVLGVARAGRQQADFEAVFPMTELPRLLPEADILVLALALNEDTRHLFDEDKLARMKAGSILVNLSRGAILVEKALEKALDGPLSGAVLDVFETEPLPEASPLWEKENLIITPHNSFVGEHNHGRMMELVLRNLRQWRNP